MGRAASVGSGSYATIASIQKYPVSSRRSPSPYATTHIALADNSGHMYVKPEYCPSRVSYYASSQLTHLSQVSNCLHVNVIYQQINITANRLVQYYGIIEIHLIKYATSRNNTNNNK